MSSACCGWDIEAFGATDEIILCPSLFASLTFWNFGYRNVTCVFGAEADALTEEFMTACAEFRIRRVMTPCEAFSSKLIEAGIDCFLLRFPIGLDANSYAVQVDDAAESLGAVIRKAEWIGNGRKGTATHDAKPAPQTTDQSGEPPDETEGPSPEAIPDAPAQPPEDADAAPSLSVVGIGDDEDDDDADGRDVATTVALLADNVGDLIADACAKPAIQWPMLLRVPAVEQFPRRNEQTTRW